MAPDARAPRLGINRRRRMLRTTCLLLLGSATVITLVATSMVGACGPPAEVVVRKAKPRPAPEPAPADYFDEFGGHRVPPGQAFIIGNDPVGVDGVRVVVALQKTEWISRTRADGTEEKQAIAHVMIVKGQADNLVTLRIHVGDSDSDLGVTVEVRDAGEEYSEQTMRWTAHAELVVSAQQ